MFKPFKPPLKMTQPKSAPIDLTESSDHTSDSDEEPVNNRPTKRRKLLVHVVEDSPPPKTQASSAVSAPRKPLIVKSTNEPKPVKANASEDPEDPEGYYMVLWRKVTNKKHKTWDGDGVLSVRGGYARLQDVSGREMGKCMFNDALLPGSTLSVGGKEVEIDSTILKADFLAGKPFLKTSSKQPTTSDSYSSPALPKKTISLPKSKMPLFGARKGTDDLGEISAENFYSAPKKSVAMGAQFKNPLLTTTIMPQNSTGAPQPRHDPSAENAVVMKRPMDCPRGKQIVDVVIDPFLGKHLRKHQQEGVKFLYECVMGIRDFNGQGAVLADEMGLGKTLQTIALIWTLLKQNPIHGSEGVIKKALIVCPVTLIDNWKSEFRKWLGNERIGVFVAESKKGKLTDFTHGKSYSVMIIGYEKLRTVQEQLKKGGGIDIVIADEGHRLKTAQNKSALAIKNLNTPRRIILSGTPIQNDLSEFYTMVDFVNPGLLATYNTFKKEFEAPILRSRLPEASEGEVEKGTAREAELSSLTKMFILRRTAEIMAEFLKPKTEYVVFCKPTQTQVQVYNHVLQSPFCGKILGGGGSESSLQLITLLKKVCNAPSLLLRKDGAAPSNSNVAELLKVIPKELLQLAPVRASTKFRVLDSLLKHLSSTTKEKVVIVSNYTQTLDIIGKHLVSLNLTFLRLDGSTPAAKRQDLVNAFNKTSASNNFAFLLSAKSGGSGLNLIGASRLILFDPDWNPSTDLQAMARIHRDGQKLPVKIYRFLMAGGMDEKVYQRQLSKRGLADSVVDGKKSESSFSAAELRDLFRLDLGATCQTHDLLGCDCKGLGLEPPSLAVDVEEDDEGMLDEDVGNESDDSVDLPIMNLVPGTKANVNAIQMKILAEAEEKRIKKAKGKMQALMRYKHIDTSVLNGELLDAFDYETREVVNTKALLEDDVLASALSDMNCKVSFVFSKKE